MGHGSGVGVLLRLLALIYPDLHFLVNFIYSIIDEKGRLRKREEEDAKVPPFRISVVGWAWATAVPAAAH